MEDEIRPELQALRERIERTGDEVRDETRLAVGIGFSSG